MEGKFKSNVSDEVYEFLTVNNIAMGWRVGAMGGGGHPSVSFPLGHRWQAEFELLEEEEPAEKKREVLNLTQKEFDMLYEYSSSVPTGTTIGKRWKRRCTDGWLIGEYYDIGSDKEIGIKWWGVNIIPDPVKPKDKK